MTVVVDSSVVGAAPWVTAHSDNGRSRCWSRLPLAAPHLTLVEAANVLRRSALAVEISADVASLAHADLVSLPVKLFPYTVCADRMWELRANITAYDAWYIALAETLSARLATLDIRLSRAAGTRCEFTQPPA